jgi:hypothetical protein
MSSKTVNEIEEPHRHMYCQLTIGGYNALIETHDVEFRKDYVLFISKVKHRPTLQFCYKSLPAEVIPNAK